MRGCGKSLLYHIMRSLALSHAECANYHEQGSNANYHEQGSILRSRSNLRSRPDVRLVTATASHVKYLQVSKKKNAAIALTLALVRTTSARMCAMREHSPQQEAG